MTQISPLPQRTPTRRLARQDRVAIILQTARVVLRERGAENFLPLEVAQRCGVSEGTIYKYFKTKRELLERVAEDWFEEFLTEEPPVSRELPIREQLYHAIWRNMLSIRREPALTRFVLMELRSEPGYRQSAIFEKTRRFAVIVMEVIDEGIRRGELRSDLPAKLIRDTIFGAIEHQTWGFLRGERDFSLDATAAGITELVLRGLTLPDVEPQGGKLDLLVERLESVSAEISAEVSKIKSLNA